MKFEFSRISEFLGSTQDIAKVFGRVEFPHPELHLINPHLPVERNNLVDPSAWEAVEAFDSAGIHYRFRVDLSKKRAYLSLTRTELMRVYNNRPYQQV